MQRNQCQVSLTAGQHFVSGIRRRSAGASCEKENHGSTFLPSGRPSSVSNAATFFLQPPRYARKARGVNARVVEAETFLRVSPELREMRAVGANPVALNLGVEGRHLHPEQTRGAALPPPRFD